MANDTLSNTQTLGNKKISVSDHAPNRKHVFAARQSHYGKGLRKQHPKEFSSWTEMCKRCLNPKYKRYAQWGGRGIGIDPAWKNFEVFLKDLGPRPEKHTLDRIDNSLGYSKANCRWADQKTQTRNTRTNRIITIDGKTHCVSEWAEIMGLKADTIFSRLWLGWTERDAIYKPLSEPHLKARANRRAA